MMNGVLSGLRPTTVRINRIFNLDIPFGIDEVPDEMFTVFVCTVVESLLYVKTGGCCGTPEEETACSSEGCAPELSMRKQIGVPGISPVTPGQ
jgi:hypothetical protein